MCDLEFLKLLLDPMLTTDECRREVRIPVLRNIPATDYSNTPKRADLAPDREKVRVGEPAQES